jgi:LysM repeat protein
MRAIALFAVIASLTCVQAQTYADPAQREDAELERKKLLRAADALDALQSKVETQSQEIEALRTELAKLQTETASLRSQLQASEGNRLKERKALIDEVSALMASKKTKSESSKPTPPPAPKENAGTADTGTQKGYEHVVQKGETLYLISQAYAAEGVKVSVSDLRKANHLGPNDPLKVGQKLFIPQK